MGSVRAEMAARPLLLFYTADTKALAEKVAAETDDIETGEIKWECVVPPVVAFGNVGADLGPPARPRAGDVRGPPRRRADAPPPPPAASPRRAGISPTASRTSS